MKFHENPSFKFQGFLSVLFSFEHVFAIFVQWSDKDFFILIAEWWFH